MKRRRRLTCVVLLSATAMSGRGDRTRTYNRWFWRPVLCQLSYTPAIDRLLGLAVKRMSSIPGTVFHELDPIRIVLLVLPGGIRPLLALGAGQLDRRTRLDSRHLVPTRRS